MKIKNNASVAELATEGLLVIMLAGLTLYLTGCSFKVGIEYNGKTGIDNKTQTQLVGTEHFRNRKNADVD